MDKAGDFTEVTERKAVSRRTITVARLLVIDDWDTARRFAYDQEATGQEVGQTSVRVWRQCVIPPTTAHPKKLRDDDRLVLLDRLGVTPAGRLRLKKAGVFPHPASEIVDDIYADLGILAEARLLGTPRKCSLICKAMIMATTSCPRCCGAQKHAIPIW